MASFDLQNYVTVEQLKEQFFAKYPDGRIVTQNLTSDQDRQVSTWVVVAAIYLTAEEQERNLPKATGHAFEIDGVNGTANKFSALENCESSAIGRAWPRPCWGCLRSWNGSKSLATAKRPRWRWIICMKWRRAGTRPNLRAK